VQRTLYIYHVESLFHGGALCIYRNRIKVVSFGIHVIMSTRGKENVHDKDNFGFVQAR
jgi:hypothetical protein